MQDDIDRELLSADTIKRRVRELAQQITADHSDGNEITIVAVLTGAMIFCGDLIRDIPLPLRIGLMTVSSYPGASISTQGSTVLSQQLGDVRGRHVLLIDDILDSGGTLRKVVPIIESLNPLSVKTCVLLKKDRPEAHATPVDYVGFEIPDEFIVGYGLDYDDYYRNLPSIVTLKKEAIDRGKPR